MTQSDSAWDRLPIVRQLAGHNPLHGNPLQCRNDLCAAVLQFFEPLKPYFSEGNARLRISAGAAHYDETAAEMEAFVRPLWGLAPLVAGGYAFEDASRYVEGLSHGMDPDHPEYWGNVGSYDQRMVEMAGIALAFLLAPQMFWEPMSEHAKKQAESWLLSINTFDIPDNNWLFFRILTNLALRHVGRQWSEKAVRTSLERIETFYLGGGYYRDGEWRQRDYYLPMALHFYGLFLAGFAEDLLPDDTARYRERARLFAEDFQYWFADDGAAVPFGRSLTYRFAQGAFWAGCAFANEAVLPWGRIKGLLLRHLRWWSERPIADRDGILSIGYAYPNLLVSEAYNAPGSPYWALKIFLVLALSDDHPFWTAEEEDPGTLPSGRITAPAAGFAMRRSPGDAVILTGGQDGHEHRAYDAKYGRFAYSSAFAFSVKSDASAPDYPDRSAVDSGMMVSCDGLNWISRGHITEAGIDSGMVWGAWQPDDRLRIETWLDFAGEGWHIRLHRIQSKNTLWLGESGFAVDRTGDAEPDFSDGFESRTGKAVIRTKAATSAIIDLSGERAVSIVKAAPNTNLRFPRTLFPRLDTKFPPGEHFVATAVFAVTCRVGPLPPVDVPDLVVEFCKERVFCQPGI